MEKHPLLKEVSELKLEDVTFCIFDTETTGDNQKRVDKPIEIAVVKWNLKNGFFAGLPKSWLIDPQMPIHPSAIAVHGLVDEDVEGKPLLDEILPELHEYIQGTALVAHNIEFDLNMLPTFYENGIARLDCLRFARKIYQIGEPGYKEQLLTSHKSQELRYWLNLKVDTMGLMAHRAAADILVTGEVFHETLKRCMERSNIQTLGELKSFIEAPIFKDTFNFGKYKNVLIQEAINLEFGKNMSKNYFHWLFDQIENNGFNVDVDLLYSMKLLLQKSGVDPTGLVMKEEKKSWKDVRTSRI